MSHKISSIMDRGLGKKKLFQYISSGGGKESSLQLDYR